jgi:hypothetical protein
MERILILQQLEPCNTQLYAFVPLRLLYILFHESQRTSLKVLSHTGPCGVPEMTVCEEATVCMAFVTLPTTSPRDVSLVAMVSIFNKVRQMKPQNIPAV